ncbi:hypothetical protein Tco_0349456, partial [Tanacetum coccineum]
EKVWDDIPTLHLGFVLGGKNGVWVEEALRLQAAFNEEDRLAREKAQQVEEANIAWDDIQAKIDVDYQLAERLQAQEQDELTIKEKSTLFQQLLKKRRKFFTGKSRRSPKTLNDQVIVPSIQELFDKAMTRVNTFADMDTKLVEGSKQKVDEDKETVELQSLMKVIPDEEEVAVDAIPLATKPPSIVDYKIIKEGKISYYQIIRFDGRLKRPKEGYERVIWGDLKTMFEHHVEDLKRDPLTPATATMLNKKLQADHWNEMCYQLLKLITKQLKNQ